MKARYLTPEEVERLRDANPVAWLPFEIASATGLRIGDVLKIRVSDITPRGVRFVAQKTGKRGEAFVTESQKLSLMRSSRGGRWCFPSPADKRKHLTRQAAWARLKRASALAGIDSRGVSPHSFRKVFAVELLHKTNLAEVQRALQHDRADVTEIYALADWATGSNAALPLTRGDLPLLVGQILSILGYGIDGRPKA